VLTKRGEEKRGEGWKLNEMQTNGSSVAGCAFGINYSVFWRELMVTGAIWPSRQRMLPYVININIFW
jgi:hypothetical protein